MTQGLKRLGKTAAKVGLEAAEKSMNPNESVKFKKALRDASRRELSRMIQQGQQRIQQSGAGAMRRGRRRLPRKHIKRRRATRRVQRSLKKTAAAPRDIFHDSSSFL